MLEQIKKYSFFAIVPIVAICVILFMRYQPAKQADVTAVPIPTSPEQIDDPTVNEDPVVIIDIKGEVKHPGVYELTIDSRVIDAVQIAGGFTDEADERFVNLAQKVVDEMSILVPGKNEALNLGAEAMDGSSSKVRINYATVEEVQTLSGIGPSKAQAIITYREENGLFQNTEDLLNVSGIGEKTLENIIDDILIP